MVKQAYNLWRLYREAVRGGRFAMAVEIAREAVSCPAVRGDATAAAVWQRAVANGFLLQGKYDEAASEAKRAIKLGGDDYEIALSLIALGQAQTYAGRYRSALNYFARAAKIAETHAGDVYLWTHLYGGRALAFRRTGKLDRAIVDWEGAAALLSQQGLLWRAALYVNNIGYLFMLGSHLKEAEQRVLKALELVERDPHPHSEAVIYDTLGCVYTRMGQHSAAQTFLRRSVRAFEELGDNSQLVQVLVHLSELRLRMQEYDDSHTLALRALDIAIETGSESLVSEARENLKKLTLTRMRPSDVEVENITKTGHTSVRKVVRLQDYRSPNSRS